MGKPHELPFGQAFGQGERQAYDSISIRTEGGIEESCFCKVLPERNVWRTIIQCHSIRAFKHCFNGASVFYFKTVIRQSFSIEADSYGLHHPAILLYTETTLRMRNPPERSIQSAIHIPPTKTAQSAARIGEVAVHPDGMA